MRMVRTVSIVVPLVALLVALLALTGCATGGSPDPGSKTSPAPTVGPGETAAEPPTLKLVEPVDAATVPAGDISVRVETTGLEFVMPSNTNVPGQGHVHFTLDDEPFKMSTEPAYTFKDVAPGAHRLKAELVQNNTQSFDPPVVQEISFTAQ